MDWGDDAPTDDALIAAVEDQRGEALGEIYRRHGGAVWAVAKLVCREADLAEEVCQAVFTELWSHPERFDRGGVRSRLVAEAHARAVDIARSEEATRRAEQRDPEADPTPPSAEVEVAAHAAALAERARQAVDRLATAERDAILLAYFGGHAYSETARRLGAPDGALKSRIRRGLLNLRQALEGEEVTR